MDNGRLKDLLEVFLTLQVTKELPRQGFFYSGFKRNDADSVAAHSFNVAAFSYLLARELRAGGKDIDPDHTLKVAIIHDMGESITGDVGVWVKVLAGGKFEEVESKAAQLLFRNLSDRNELVNLFEEYNTLETFESHVVKFVDVLDAIAQGLSTPGANLNDWKMTKDRLVKSHVKDPELLQIFENAVDMLVNKKVSYFRGHIKDEDTDLKNFVEDDNTGIKVTKKKLDP